jgi:FKBP-type peptidyl-prolyl cis-trans isomerase FkpA/FKBP-type peptidyl-prolyl cis-trans isomerase FklB
MKRQVILASVVFVATASLFCDKLNANQGTKKLETPEQKFSYAIGLDIGATLKDMPAKLDLPAIYQGMQDTLGGKKLALTPEEVTAIKTEFFQKMQAEQTKKAAEAGAKNKAEGDKFLEENKKKEGVKTTASGLQYQVLKEGTGAKPKVDDVVTVNYRGTLLDGTVFDDSYSRGEPATFQLNQVIPGWTEGLQLMPVGSKYKFWIPSQLGYGERGAGQKIGPNSVLIFEVELLDIKKPNQPQNAPAPAPAPSKK